MKYKIIFDKYADRQLREIDITQQRIIVNWITGNLEDTNNPKLSGKPLKGKLKGYWRYRVGQYRIIADIIGEEIKIFIIKVGHRKDIYK